MENDMTKGVCTNGCLVVRHEVNTFHASQQLLVPHKKDEKGVFQSRSLLLDITLYS